jgi:hypothetical protein
MGIKIDGHICWCGELFVTCSEQCATTVNMRQQGLFMPDKADLLIVLVMLNIGQAYRRQNCGYVRVEWVYWLTGRHLPLVFNLFADRRDARFNLRVDQIS